MISPYWCIADLVWDRNVFSKLCVHYVCVCFVCVDDVSLTPLRQQIFLGLVSSQYQARPDVVRLISGLDSACIRFVYFSSEEEVRSKVRSQLL